jgi:hypothetical protein
MFLHNDVVANGKSLAGALSNLFRREEGVEDSGADRQRNASPVVLDFDLNIIVDLSRADGELSTLACLLRRGLTDRVRSVHDEVQKNLIHLVGIAFEARQVGLIVGLNIRDDPPRLTGLKTELSPSQTSSHSLGPSCVLASRTSRCVHDVHKS